MAHSTYINQIFSNPGPYQVHDKFIEFVPRFLNSPKEKKLFSRLIKKSQIEKRYSVLQPSQREDVLDTEGFYHPKNFPDTEQRMQKYQASAMEVVAPVLQQLFAKEDPREITHLIVTSCTGFYAPGIDIDIVKNFDLPNHVERFLIGFMGCYAAFNGMKQARSIIAGNPEAKVLMVNIELCSLHLQKSSQMDELLSYLLFGDGAAATLLSAESEGIELKSFHNAFFEPMGKDDHELITWQIHNQGFKMHLDTRVPQAIKNLLMVDPQKVLGPFRGEEFELAAVHPGGRSILDSVQSGLDWSDEKMKPSREVLREFGNMSSATIMFVLQKILYDTSLSGNGIALGFGPGLTVETMGFYKRPM